MLRFKLRYGKPVDSYTKINQRRMNFSIKTDLMIILMLSLSLHFFFFQIPNLSIHSEQRHSFVIVEVEKTRSICVVVELYFHSLFRYFDVVTVKLSLFHTSFGTNDDNSKVRTMIISFTAK